MGNQNKTTVRDAIKELEGGEKAYLLDSGKFQITIMDEEKDENGIYITASFPSGEFGGIIAQEVYANLNRQDRDVMIALGMSIAETMYDILDDLLPEDDPVRGWLGFAVHHTLEKKFPAVSCEEHYLIATSQNIMVHGLCTKDILSKLFTVLEITARDIPREKIVTTLRKLTDAFEQGKLKGALEGVDVEQLQS